MRMQQQLRNNIFEIWQNSTANEELRRAAYCRYDNISTVIWAAEIFLVESIGVRTIADGIRSNLDHRTVLWTMLWLAKRQAL